MGVGQPHADDYANLRTTMGLPEVRPPAATMEPEVPVVHLPVYPEWIPDVTDDVWALHAFGTVSTPRSHWFLCSRMTEVLDGGFLASPNTPLHNL